MTEDQIIEQMRSRGATMSRIDRALDVYRLTGSADMLIQAGVIDRVWVGPNPNSDFNDLIPPPVNAVEHDFVFTSHRPKTINSALDTPALEKALKKRHLNSDERGAYHQPKSDWCETGRGDMCKSACSLEVEDLVVKIK